MGLATYDSYAYHRVISSIHVREGNLMNHHLFYLGYQILFDGLVYFLGVFFIGVHYLFSY
jgi:hypothetical protein